MSKLEELIEKLCPGGVKCRSISEFASCYAGATPKTDHREYWDNGTIPWMSSGEVHNGQITSTASHITKEGYASCSTKMVPINSVVIALAGQGKTRGTVAITRIELCTNQSLCAVVPNETVFADYLYYYLQTQYKYMRTISAGDGSRGGLNLQMIKGLKIPVPPLPVQRKIVRDLDAFTGVIANIESELALRRKQYEYYRDKLLAFKEA